MWVNSFARALVGGALVMFVPTLAALPKSGFSFAEIAAADDIMISFMESNNIHAGLLVR